MDRQPIISAKDVEITFSLRGRKLNAIRKCSLDLYEGETLAIVGESGSGKSVFTKTFVGMLDVNGKITGGSIMYEGRDMTKFTEKDWLGVRGKKIAMVMQDPMTSLNPLKKIGKQIQESIEHHQGLKGEAAARTRALLEEKEPLELVDEALIPALDIVGAKYEKGTLFLPQLLQAATAAQGAFEEIKTAIAQKGEGSASKGRIVIATVKGDVHDIGKNIVRVILENYGFEVIDLGRDVPVETVVNTVREKDVHLVGLSALMTTTLKSMEETIRALHDAKLDCKIMVGGAVLTPEYAKKIGADWYAKDAKQSADIAKEFFGV